MAIKAVASFLQGGSNMGRRIAEFGWRDSLGDPADWPEPLKTAVRIMLSAKQPMCIWWGENHVNLYNDSYISILGEKHPDALGRPASQVWQEIWDELAPRVEKVVNEDISTYDESLLLLINRHGYTEETYFTISYSPIPGQDGRVQGVFCVYTDDTARILNQRGIATLRTLAKNLMLATSNTEIYRKTLENLSENVRDFPFVALYEVNDDGNSMQLKGRQPELPNRLAPEMVNFPEVAESYPELVRCISGSSNCLVPDVDGRFGPLPESFWRQPVQNALLVPILQPNHQFPFAVLCVGLNPFRLVDDAYLDFLNLIADQLTNALTAMYSVKRERKRSEALAENLRSRIRMQENESRYKLAMEAARLGSFEWSIHDDQFLFTERLAEIFGFRDPSGVDHINFIDHIHPDDMPIRNAAIEKSFETGVLYYEARIIWDDGSTHWIRLYGKIEKDKDNQLEKMYGTVLDITDEKIHTALLEEKVQQRTESLAQRNRELKESEERFQRMTEEIQDYAILLLDVDGIVLNWNKGAQKIKGYRDTEIVGKSFTVFYPERDRESGLPQRFLEEARRNGRAEHEGYRIRKGGSAFYASVTITALHDDEGNIIGFSKVTRDLTERKQAADRMQQYNTELEFQNRELEQFAYIASHDLQEPLRKIRMFSGMLERNLHDPEVAARYFSKINSSAERMSDLIRAVLNYSRLSKAQNEFLEVDLDAALQNVLVDFELLIEEKNAQVFYDKLPTVTAIPLQINQLLYNLVGNALKFCEKEPVIQVRAHTFRGAEIEGISGVNPEKNYLELQVVDNGIGFDQKYADQIFTIFQRLNQRTDYSGTGIGLALCKRIAENHQGFIKAESVVGEGSRFLVYFPLPD